MNKKWSNRVITAAIFLSGFSAAHLIDDFLYGVPAEFSLTNQISQVLSILYFAIISFLLVLATRGSKAGYIGNMALGLFLLLADISKHGTDGLFTGPWRDGVFSRALAFGLMAAALILVVTSFTAWQATHRISYKEDVS